MPPLRERRADVALLARHLLSRNALQYGSSEAASDRVLQFLTPLFERYAWPGNVRELENLPARAAIYLGDTASDQRVDPEGNLQPDLLALFPEFSRMGHAGGNGRLIRTAADAARVAPSRDDALEALARCGGNRAAASRALGIGRTTLWRLLKADEAR